MTKQIRWLWLPLLIFLLCSCGNEPSLNGQAPNKPDTSVTEPGNNADNSTGDSAGNNNGANTETPSGNAGSVADGNSETDTGADGGADATPPPPEPEKSADATWVAVGDIMMHMPQLPGAYNEKTNTYNFNSFFTSVKPILEQGDWTLANLETPLGGKSLGYSGYPRFNAPSELGDALKDAGFTTVTNANNHALDRGAKGISNTLAYLEKLGFDIKGTARSKYESEKITIVERKGIKMGLLAYTYGTNGIPLPKGQPYAVSLIDEAKMLQDIKKVRAAGADFITVVLHFGIEYQTAPNDMQKQLARKLIAAGADIIAGSHPHVVQPYEMVEAAQPDGTVHKGLIIYSMGNFISSQQGNSKDFGVIYKVQIHKDGPTKQTTITDVEAIPTWVHRVTTKGISKFSVVPLKQTIDTKPLKDLSAADYRSLTSMYSQLTKRLHAMSAKPLQLPAAR
ncbi:poly-gamma-glutamate synthesis protein (capsule biosynthesis protein) [Paenibacillus taihuensis]|uniref:Poly-gamma-glutamate synthesis protein (Capsule biosynthesis protein) n=1 Tax=Paenibacillus taihuensis TaxID=1156355 RepID=A0A3D9S6H5_9BACL|nr:CapA family protein [Paenibacillus taihuensis]REE88584.1 poly-gamma-glutamate synthesis protein (capsule biosynthesis protein) [Paenibacillus taihuensis]